jgi:fibronectin-binding autotransporter adhesin
MAKDTDNFLKSSFGWLEMVNYSTAPTDVDSDRRGLAFVAGVLKYYNGSSFVAISGSGGVSTWDELYDADKTLTIDDTTLTFQVTKAGIAGLTLAGNATATGAILAFSNSGSGVDVLGTSSAWQVTKAGAATFASVIAESITAAANLTIDATGTGTIIIGGTSTGAVTIGPALTATASITITGSADANVLTVTAGDILVSNGKIAITNDDTDAIATLTANATTTGNAILLTANGITSGTMVSLVTTSAGFSGGYFIACNDGSNRFTVGVDGATTVTSAVASTAALAVTGIQTSENMVAFSSNGVTASGYGTLKVTAAGATAAGSAVLLVTHTGTPAAATSYLAHFDYTPATEATNDPITVQISSGTSIGAALNITSTATTITGGILNITNAEMTTGVGINMTGMAALTTGQGIKMAHATSAIADGGSMIAIASSGVNTGGATNGTMLDIKATGQLAGTMVRIDSIQTTGTVASIISTGIMTTTGNLLTLTANSATTAAGLLRINANGLTDGIGLAIASSSTALTGAGRLVYINHTGDTTAATTAKIFEIASAATDDTEIFKVTASAALAAGIAANISAVLMTTGTALKIGDLDALTTGTGISLVSNSADTTARNLMYIKNDNAAAVGAIPLTIANDAVVGTGSKWVVAMKLASITIYVGTDETEPEGALTGVKGDLCFNSTDGSISFCDANGTNWTKLT